MNKRKMKTKMKLEKKTMGKKSAKEKRILISRKGEEKDNVDNK